MRWIPVNHFNGALSTDGKTNTHGYTVVVPTRTCPVEASGACPIAVSRKDERIVTPAASDSEHAETKTTEPYIAVVQFIPELLFKGWTMQKWQLRVDVVEVGVNELSCQRRGRVFV